MQRLSRNTLLILVLALAAGIGVFSAFAQDSSSVTYVVETGDVLDSIAAGFDVQTNCLAEINDLSRPDRIKPGQVLLISYDCPPYDGPNFVTNPRDTGISSDLGQGGGGAETPELGLNDQVYTVVRGDTLDSIAQQFDVSLQSLQQTNGFSIYNSKIYVGQSLVIPGEAPPYGTYPGVANPLNPLDTSGQGGGGPEVQPGDSLYVVQPRDVLDLIGAKFDVQVACLTEANSIGRLHIIYPGQTLVIPSSCPLYDGEAFVENPRSG
ncbi:MAG: LysM peptidoglycan-binding domain-containing protein [Anaerolineaceae bacterium]|nr:LysM peptidoglycan-binding domain-containing protein [Anaerolineaceae bacterium]